MTTPLDTLRIKFNGRSSQTMIEATIARIVEKTSWEDFVANYPHGKLMPPFSIKNEVEEYYTPAPAPAPPPPPFVSVAKKTT